MNDNSLIPYEPRMLSDLSSTFDDFGHAIASMGRLSDSTLELTDYLHKIIDEVYRYVPTLSPIAIGAGCLLGAFLITGTINNVMNISKQSKNHAG